MGNTKNLLIKATNKNQNNKYKGPSLVYTQLHHVFCSYNGIVDSWNSQNSQML